MNNRQIWQSMGTAYKPENKFFVTETQNGVENVEQLQGVPGHYYTTKRDAVAHYRNGVRSGRHLDNGLSNTVVAGFPKWREMALKNPANPASNNLRVAGYAKIHNKRSPAKSKRSPAKSKRTRKSKAKN